MVEIVGIELHLNALQQPINQRIITTNRDALIGVVEVVIIVGNEGRGISEEIKKYCKKNIYIGMNDECESLNVGVSASIIMYEVDNKWNMC